MLVFRMNNLATSFDSRFREETLDSRLVGMAELGMSQETFFGNDSQIKIGCSQNVEKGRGGQGSKVLIGKADLWRVSSRGAGRTMGRLFPPE